MAYRNLSRTEVTISHKAKLSWIYETKVWDKFIKRHTLAKTRVKRTVFSPAMPYGNLPNGYQPIRMGQIFWR